jgi:hypothetical protein
METAAMAISPIRGSKMLSEFEGTGKLARRLSKRRSRLFCLFASAANLSFLPWGTLLGMYSIVVLNRPGIRVAFGCQVLPMSSE